MAIKLNLLPEDYTVSGSLAAVLKIAKPLNVILLTIFLISTLGTTVFFVFSSITIKSLNTGNELLKSNIQSQQSAQQQAVLLKDRLGKIKRVFVKPNAFRNLTAINPIIASLPATSSVSELTIDFQKIEMGVIFTNNSDLRNFMEYLNSQTAFSNVSIDSFYYNGTDGYLVNLIFMGQGSVEQS